jgi:hypothetical protein
MTYRDRKSMILVALIGSLTASEAADMPMHSKAAPLPERIEYGNLFFGADWNSHKSLAGYMGMLYAPSGMHQSGLRLAGFGLIGHYEYHSDIDLFKGNFVSADAMAGWSHVFSYGALTFLGGVNYQDHRVRPNDPSNPVQGSKAGAKIQGDLWLNPTPSTLLYGLASYSTAFDTYYIHGKWGYDIFKSKTFFGPEVIALGNDRTDQVRLGAHLTGISVGAAKLNISGGWMKERGEGGGAYAQATVDFSF